jgi:hypothetical protein
MENTIVALTFLLLLYGAVTWFIGIVQDKKKKKRKP